MLIFGRAAGREGVAWLRLVHGAAAAAAGYSQSMVLHKKPRSARGTGYLFHVMLPDLNVCQVDGGKKNI